MVLVVFWSWWSWCSGVRGVLVLVFVVFWCISQRGDYHVELSGPIICFSAHMCRRLFFPSHVSMIDDLERSRRWRRFFFLRFERCRL